MTARTMTMVKGPHKYVFRYSSGSEKDIVEEIVRLADDPDCSLDWLDAATLGFQVAQNAGVQSVYYVPLSNDLGRILSEE